MNMKKNFRFHLCAACAAFLWTMQGAAGVGLNNFTNGRDPVSMAVKKETSQVTSKVRDVKAVGTALTGKNKAAVVPAANKVVKDVQSIEKSVAGKEAGSASGNAAKTGAAAATGAAMAEDSNPPAETGDAPSSGTSTLAPIAPKDGVKHEATGTITGEVKTGEAKSAAKSETKPHAPQPRLLSLDILKKYDRKRRKNIQDALYEIYRDDPDYMAARAEASKPLSDDAVGPITLSYINRFWLYYNMAPVGNLTDASVDAMLHFANMIKRFPQWRTDLLSSGFGDWIDARAMPEKAEDYRIRLAVDEKLLPPLLQRYHANVNVSPTGDVDDENEPLSVYWYGLTADDFTTLEGRAALAPALAGLTGQTFASRLKFEKAVLTAMKETTKQGSAYLPQIERYARGTGYTLGSDGMDKLRNVKGMPPEVLDAIASLQDDAYADKGDMERATTDAIDAVSTGDGENPEQDTAQNSGQESTQYAALVMQEAKAIPVYRLTDAVLAKLASDPKNAQVPAVLLTMLADLSGISYPRRSLFDKAVLFKLRTGIGACMGSTSNYEQNQEKKRKITPEEFQALKESVGEPLGSQLDKLSHSDECDAAQRAEMDTRLSELYGRYRPAIGELARKMPLYDDTKRVNWVGDTCGCNNDGMSGMVYDFFPFWMAGETQHVNFSKISRIGYYGVTFDNQGVLRMANDGRAIKDVFLNADSTQLSFISEARRHRVKIDWVIHKTDWQVWRTLPDAERRKVLNRLQANIIDMLGTKLTDLPSRATPYLSFGTASVPVRGDGVALYFDGYPQDEASAALFSDFVKNLQTALRSHGFTLNLVMRQSAMSKATGIFTYAKLLDMTDVPVTTGFFSHKTKAKYPLPHFLVFIDEPTTEAKKTLRLDIESALHGKERERVLRQIVPVIEFGGKDWQQLEDDIIYSQDNFGGIGFWPLVTQNPAAGAPAAGGVQHCTVSKSVDVCLRDYYQVRPGVSASKLSNFVCENRWAFRLGIDMIVLILLAGTAVYFWFCQVRPFMEKYYFIPIVIGAMGVADFVALVSFDPYFNHLSQGFVIPAILLAVIVGIIVYYRRKFKVRDEQP